MLSLTIMYLVAPKVGHEHELLFSKPYHTYQNNNLISTTNKNYSTRLKTHLGYLEKHPRLVEKSELTRLSRGQFVEQKLLLSCSFRCDNIYSNHWCELGRTAMLLNSDLVVNKPTSDAMKLLLCTSTRLVFQIVRLFQPSSRPV